MKFIKYLGSLIVIILAAEASLAQDKYQVKLSWWTDTVQHAELKPLVKLYSNYINSRPDSIYNNPYWNSAEKKKYKEFDFSRNSIFQGDLTAERIFSKFRPMLLKADKRDSNYLLTVVLQAKDSTQDINAAYDPLAIMNYVAVQENGQWKLANYLPYLTKGWPQHAERYFTFYTQPGQEIEPAAVESSLRFCDSLTYHFNLDTPELIKVFVVNGPHEVGELMGYDYYIYGNAQGKSLNNMVFSGNGSGFYAHEFVHQLFPENEKRHIMLNEGLATWLGGTMGQSFEDKAKEFIEAYRRDESPGFVGGLEYSGFSTYNKGAVLCHFIYHKFGKEKLMELLAANTSNKALLFSEIFRITNTPEVKMEQYWEEHLSQLENELLLHK